MLKVILLMFGLSIIVTVQAQEDNCKTLGNCALWATGKTGAKYDLGKFDKRSLKLEKDFNFKEGNPDLIFNYILQSNDFMRIKRENNVYQVIAMKELKDFKISLVKVEELPVSLDFYSAEFTLANKEQVRNAMIMIKKMLSKNGKVLEIADSPKIQVTDSAIQLNSIKLLITELSK